MILYRVLDEHIVGTVNNTVFRRHCCEWILPQEVAVKVRFDPRKLPVVVEQKNADVDLGLRASILRIFRGYRVHASLKTQCEAIIGGVL